MNFRGLRWKAAAAIAFLMGVPLAEQARAQDVGDIVSSAIALALAIIDVAGNS